MRNAGEMQISKKVAICNIQNENTNSNASEKSNYKQNEILRTLTFWHYCKLPLSARKSLWNLLPSERCHLAVS